MRLYHVTTFEKAQYIINEGFSPALPSEEGVDPDQEKEYLESGEFSDERTDEQVARDALNDKLDLHGSASFFWAARKQANYLRSASRPSRYNKMVIVIIESLLSPCQFKVGDWEIAEEIFSMLESNPNLTDDNYIDEDDEDLTKQYEELDALVEKYNKGIRPLRPEDAEDENIEVMADCHIPSMAIIAVDDVPAPLWRMRNGRLPRWQGVLPI